jgi:hypothetical protein
MFVHRFFPPANVFSHANSQTAGQPKARKTGEKAQSKPMFFLWNRKSR